MATGILLVVDELQGLLSPKRDRFSGHSLEITVGFDDYRWAMRDKLLKELPKTLLSIRGNVVL